MKVLLVYNLHAGSGFAKNVLRQVETAFTKNSIEFDIQFTNYQGHGVEIVKNADFNKYDGLVAAGGDGTLFEVINGFFQNVSGIKIPIGVLPIGTGNAFARDLDLENTMWEEAIKIIATQNTRKVDVGKFHTHGQDYHYLNILGIGFVADVTKIAHKLKLFGNIAYTLGVLIRTLVLSTDRMVFEIDGQEFEYDCTFVEISNTRYTANFLMAPNAVIDDGLLDVAIAKKLSRIKLIKSFPKIFTGEHVYLSEIETFQAKRIKIKSETSKTLSPDGELIGISPVEIECLKQAVEVYWK